MKNILITGGAGFIGSNLALKLTSKGYNVTVLDNLSTQIHGEKPEENSPLYKKIKDKVNYIKGSVNNREDCLRAINGNECIVHLAAETGTGQSMYEIERYVNTNIKGTAILLDILTNTKHQVKRFLVAESRAVYGEGRYYSDELEEYVYPEIRSENALDRGDFEVKYPNCSKPLILVGTTEDSKIHPTSVYGITKQVQGQLLHLVSQSIGIESVSFRYQNVYGPGQSLSNPYTGILSIFSTLIKNNKQINIFEDGKESRDFVYIDDVVEATILGIETPNLKREVFNIGTGINIDVLTVAKTLIDKFGIEVPIKITGNYRLGDIRHNYADVTHARKKLGFSSKWSFDQGIKAFVDWVNQQNIQKDNYESSIKEMREKGLFK